MSAWTRTLTAVLALALAAIPAPAGAAEPDGIPDPGLRACIARKLDVKPTTEFTAGQLGGIASLSCDAELTGAIGELTGVARLSSLRQLNLAHQVLDDLSPLDGLHLTGLGITRSTLGDIAPLELPKIEGLSLAHSTVPSLSFVTGLPTLERIQLVGARFPGLAELASLPRLSLLHLGGNADADLTGLAGIAALRTVWFSDERATDLPDLGTPGALETLDLNAPALRSLHRISGWTSLRRLSLKTPRVSDFAPLSTLSGLQVLEASAQGLADLRPLANLTQLTSLALFGNRIVDLSPLARLTRLTSLHLGTNEIVDLTPLSGLTNLTQLNLADNHIDDVTPLRRLRKLESLDLARNRVADIAALAGLPKRAELDVSGNAVLDLSPLAGHTGTIAAAQQVVALPPARFGTPYPVRIADQRGKPPAEVWGSEGVSYRNGALHHTYAGASRVEFSYRGDQQTVLSGVITQRVGPDQQFNTPKLWLQGLPHVGMHVIATITGGWKPAPTKVRYQWYRGKTAIPGATEREYLTTAKDIGHKLRVRVRAIRDGYHTRTMWSSYTGKAGRGTFWSAPRPSISGVVKTGQKLTVTVPVRKPAATKVGHQWYRNSKKIAKATKSSYTLTAADKGKRISVRVTYQAPGIKTDRAYSKKTAKVAAGPVRSAEPTVAGAAAVGERLTVKAGSWGPGTVKLRYQWQRDGKPIKGATGRTHLVTAEDAGHDLSVKVTGSRKGYQTVTRVSAGRPIPG